MLIDFEKHFKTFYNALAIKLKSFRSDWGQNDPNANDYIKDRTHWIDDDGNIHTLDECYIPDTIARTSDVEASFSAKAEAEHAHEISDVNGLQTALDSKANSTDIVQSDWSQNDESAADYVKGRTHYEETITHDRLEIDWSGTSNGLVEMGGMYKLSSETPSIEQLQTGYIVFKSENGDETISVSEMTLLDGQTVTLLIEKDSGFYLVSFSIFEDDPPPYNGLWLNNATCPFTLIIDPYEWTESKIQALDPKYLPIASENSYGAVNNIDIREAVYPTDYVEVAIGETLYGEFPISSFSRFYYDGIDYFVHTALKQGFLSDGQSRGEWFFYCISIDSNIPCEIYLSFDGLNDDSVLTSVEIIPMEGLMSSEDKDKLDGLQNALDGKADTDHAHEIVDVTGLQAALDGKIGSPATATVGQVISVKTVDANGKPTEWEAVSMLPTVDENGVLIF